MAKLTRNFTAGKMNKVVDERLIPDGQYIDCAIVTGKQIGRAHV